MIGWAPQTRRGGARGLAALAVWALLLSGCERTPSGAAPATDETSEASSSGARLAAVDGKSIHELDLRVHLRKLLGEEGLDQHTDEVRRKALESLVMTRVIAQQAEKELSAEARARLDAQAALYRQQLLVNEYLRDHATPEPVTSSMVETYYRDNPEQFGGGHERTFELMIATAAPAAPQRDALLRSLRELRPSTDWASQVQRLRAQGFELEYRRASSDDPVLPDALRSLVANLAVDQASEPGMVQRRPYLLRVLSDRERPPRALGEVSAEIRTRLAPIQIKQAVRAIAEPLLQAAQVEYFD